MSGDVLSQEEVESLLSAVEPAGDAPESPAGPPVEDPASRPGKPGERVTAYDFKRPERVGKEQMRSLQTMHEGFSRNFGASLSALLRSIVEVKLTSVDQLTYSEFVFSLENPTCFNLLRAEPLQGNLILDINPAILYPVIDRLLGGGKDPGPSVRRPLTEIELRLVSRITNLFLKELREAWSNIIEMELGVERVESNPHLVQIVPPNEVVVLISFELTLGDVRGMMNLCIPFNAIERYAMKLSDNTWATYGGLKVSDEAKKQIGRNLKRSLVEISVDLADTTITTKDLIGLRVGDIITTDKDVNEPLVFEVEGIPKFHVSPGAFKGRKAVQVREEIQGD